MRISKIHLKILELKESTWGWLRLAVHLMWRGKHGGHVFQANLRLAKAFPDGRCGDFNGYSKEPS